MAEQSFGYKFKRERNEVGFIFPKLPEIISWVPVQEFKAMRIDQKQAYATDAVLLAVKGRRMTGTPLPENHITSEFRADGVVTVSVGKKSVRPVVRMEPLAASVDSIKDGPNS